MAYIMLVESKENSPLRGYLEEMGHSVERHLTSERGGPAEHHSAEQRASSDSESNAFETGAADSRHDLPDTREEKNPDLLIREEDIDDPQGEGLVSFISSKQRYNTPEILILSDYDPEDIRSRMGPSQFGFLVRPVTKASVMTVVGNALGRSGIHLSSVLNSLNMPFYVLDAHSYEIVLANKEALKLYRNNEKTCYELSHHSKAPCEGVHHACPLRKVLETKMPFSTEHVHYDEHGDARFVEVWGYPIMNEAGEVTHMIEYSSDITERKREEQEILKLTTAVDRTAHIILITGVDGKVEFVNRAFEMKFNCRRQEIIGRSVEELEKESKIQKFYSVLHASVSSGSSHSGEFSYTRPDGTLSWENVSVTPIRNDEGVIVNYIAVAEDISSQVKQKEALQDAKDEAERASTMKSRFLANISHELRTPLNIVLGFTDLLLDEEQSESKSRKLGNIRHAGGNLLTIINDILDFSQLEGKQLELNESPFSLFELLERVRELYSRPAEQKGLVEAVTDRLLLETLEHRSTS